MKIEKINENQIRCTLTRADLADRELKISELAYGSEKAKSLFQDMMQQAASQFGFEAENTPLMIEAVPTSPDSIVLIITKVDNPEELDTHFSKFTPSAALQNIFEKLEGAENLSDLPETKENTEDSSSKSKDSLPAQPSFRLFIFDTLDSVIEAAHLIDVMYSGANTLYKDPKENVYILLLGQSHHSSKDYNRICNMMTEYASLEKADGPTLAYLNEHCEVIVSGNATQQLANV